MDRSRFTRVWRQLLDYIAFWAAALVIGIEIIRLVFAPNSIDGIILILTVVILSSMLD